MAVDFTPFERIDRLLLIELCETNVTHGVIPLLYRVVRDEAPLSYLTARAFLDNPGSRVAFVTGSESHPFMPRGEIDGLPGSVFLGRALQQLGCEVSILTDAGCVQVLEALCQGLGADGIRVVNANSLSAADLMDYASGIDIGVAIEKVGVNRKGLRHTFEGKSYEQNKAPQFADAFIERLNGQGKLTIGYGDGGNEIGFGKIFHRAREIVPYGGKCQCPCGDGLITITPATLLWPVNVSNFGAYGTIAGLAILSGRPELALAPAELLRALDICVAAGAVDGGSGLPRPGEDGIPAPAAAAYVQIMKTVVEKAFARWERAF